MSSTDFSGSTDRSTTSTVDDVCSFLEPRDPSITDPRMRPRPMEGRNLCELFQEECSLNESVVDDQHVKVYLRVKPFTKKNIKKEDHYCVESKNSFITLSNDPKSNKKHAKIKKKFDFTHIFEEANNSQINIFDRMVKNDLLKFIDGQNLTIMTYGASGSGKTYTLMGTDAEPGIIPRLLENVFIRIEINRLPSYKPTDGNSVIKLNSVEKEKEIQNIQWIVKNCGGDIKSGIITDSDKPEILESYCRKSMAIVGDHCNWGFDKKNEKKYDVWVSFAEIYNDVIFDLLREDSNIPNQPPPRLRLVHVANNEAYIKGIRWIYVRSGMEAFAALERGRRHLRYAHTNVNKQSSRSHSIFFLKIVHYNSDLSDPYLSTFRLCDLAGSERAKKTGNEGVRLMESRMINSSLHVLEKCLCSLRSKQGGHQAIPPYRESKLTALLQNALCGNEAISMMVNINPDPLFSEETQHVLQFSAIAKEIVGYVEPKSEIIRRSRSFSDSLQCSYEDYSEFSTDNSRLSEVLNENKFLREEISRIKKESEEALQQKEKELRNEIVNHFLKSMKQRHDEFEEKLKTDRERYAKYHEMEIDLIKTQHQEEIEILVAEIESLKKKVSDLERNDDSKTQSFVDKDDSSKSKNKIESSPLSDISKTLNLSPIESDGTTVIIFESPISDQENIPFNIENFCTVKKEKPNNLLNDGISSVTKSKRKLFCRREFDENAAENVELCKAAKELTFENSLEDIKPPIVEKPYTIERPVRSTRKRNK